MTASPTTPAACGTAPAPPQAERAAPVGPVPRRAWLGLLAPVAVMALIWIASSTPAIRGHGPGLIPPWLQNLLHVPVFGGLCGAWLWALAGLGIHWRRAAVLAVLAAALYGIIDEGHQAFVPGRTVSPADLLLDVIGALFAVAIVRRHRPRPLV